MNNFDSTTFQNNRMPNVSMPDMPDLTFKEFWQKFSTVVKNRGYSQFKQMSLSILKCQDKTIKTITFIDSTFGRLFDAKLIHNFSDSSKVSFTDTEVENGYFNASVSKVLKNSHLVREVSVTEIDKSDGEPVIFVLKFVQTKTGYKFFGYDIFGGVLK